MEGFQTPETTVVATEDWLGSSGMETNQICGDENATFERLQPSHGGQSILLVLTATDIR